MEKKVYFSNDDKDIKLAEKLCTLCSEGLDLPKSSCVLKRGSKDLSDGYDAVAVELGFEDKVQSAEKVFTYSVGQSNADICALNFQKREFSRSLELLCGSVMGRVNIPLESQYTELSVLYCASGLYASGVDMKDVLKLINENIR
jgi:hypothetical protein